MIKIPDHSWWQTQSARRANFREVFARLTQAVQSTLAASDSIYTKKKTGIIAWKRAPLQALQHWKLYFVWLTQYDSSTFRLRSDFESTHDITATFWPPVRDARRIWGQSGERLAKHYRFELSFCAEDLPQVATPDLVRFVESTFEHPDDAEAIWSWPLFAHDQTYPHYAWTVAGSRECERRRAIREKYQARSQKTSQTL
jgi:hypothetical protein